jgi:hypothetical protein
MENLNHLNLLNLTHDPTDGTGFYWKKLFLERVFQNDRPSKCPLYFHFSEVGMWLCLVLSLPLSCMICTAMHLLLSALVLLVTSVENLLKTIEMIRLVL